MEDVCAGWLIELGSRLGRLVVDSWLSPARVSPALLGRGRVPPSGEAAMTEARTAGVRCSLSVHLVAAWRFSPVAGPFGAPAGQRRFAVAWARRASAAGSLYRVVAALTLVGGVTGDPGGAGRGRCPGALPGGWRRAVARWWGHFSAPIPGPQNGSAQLIHPAICVPLFRNVVNTKGKQRFLNSR